jgi:hypothetical protein
MAYRHRAAIWCRHEDIDVVGPLVAHRWGPAGVGPSGIGYPNDASGHHGGGPGVRIGRGAELGCQ